MIQKKIRKESRKKTELKMTRVHAFYDRKVTHNFLINQFTKNATKKKEQKK